MGVRTAEQQPYTIHPQRLTPMKTLPVQTWISNAAAVLSGPWGAVSAHCQLVGCSRQAAYQQAHLVSQAVAAAQQGPPHAALLQHVAQLSVENRQLWQELE